MNRKVRVYLVRRNACRMKKLATNAQEKSKSKVTFCLATTHILNVVTHFEETFCIHIDIYDLLRMF